jgi:hypothetical protein
MFGRNSLEKCRDGWEHLLVLRVEAQRPEELVHEQLLGASEAAGLWSPKQLLA